MAPPPTDWKSNMSKDDRIKICQHILDKLVDVLSGFVPTSHITESCQPDFDYESLKVQTRRFEMGVFQSAVSRQDYLEKIAEGLSRIEWASANRVV